MSLHTHIPCSLSNTAKPTNFHMINQVLIKCKHERCVPDSFFPFPMTHSPLKSLDMRLAFGVFDDSLSIFLGLPIRNHVLNKDSSCDHFHTVGCSLWRQCSWFLVGDEVCVCVSVGHLFVVWSSVLWDFGIIKRLFLLDVM